MTDVIDDSLSWEQRRELRRKKRQELLAEADRLVNTDTVTSSRTNDKSTDGDNSFEQERQRRRREREEKRKREREELEKQLKEEEEARAERERRREERRRQREEGDSIISHRNTLKDSYSYTSTSITKTTRMRNDSGGEEDVTETTEVSKITEVVSTGQEDYATQNGDDENAAYAHDESEEAAVEKSEEEVQEEDDKGYKTYTSVTITTRMNKDIHRDESSSSDAEEEKDGPKRPPSDHSSSDHEEKPKSRSEVIEERRKQREQRLLEEEQQKKAEEEKRKEEYEAKLKAEREVREQRMAEGEAKRRDLRKQLSEEPLPISPKGNAATPLGMKMKNLSDKMTDSPKTSKPTDTNIAKLSSLDDRLKNYTRKAQKQEPVKKGVAAPKPIGSDVANRLNMWESGRVTGIEKTPKKVLDTSVVKQGAAVSSRKNMWESGRVGSSVEKKTARADVHGADFSSRKNMWLKATEESAKSTPMKSSEGPVPIKTGVLSRLSKWEKGEVGSGASAKEATKKTSDLPISDVVNRRNKWENLAHDSPSQPIKTKTVVTRTMITTDVSNRKNLYENKDIKSSPKNVEHKPRSTYSKEVEQDIESEEEYVPEPKRRESLSSSSGSDEEEKYGREVSASGSEDEHHYGRPASSGSDGSDQE